MGFNEEAAANERNSPIPGRRRDGLLVCRVFKPKSFAGLLGAGAALKSFGLMAFAIVVWGVIDVHSTGIVLLRATFAWMLVTGLLWYMRKKQFGLRILRAGRPENRKTHSLF